MSSTEGSLGSRTTHYVGRDFTFGGATHSGDTGTFEAADHQTLSRRVEKGIGPRGAEAGVAPAGRVGQPLPEFSRGGAEVEPASSSRQVPSKKARQAPKSESGQFESDDLARRDAWFASYGTTISGVLSSARSTQASRATSTMVSEIIMAGDDRVRVQDTRAIPYRWTCCLTILAANGTQWMGTGWFAAPRLIVTAGHCVYLHNHGGWVESVRIEPARNGGDVPFSLHCTSVLSVRGWVEQKRSASDYGALVLSRTDADSAIGYYGYAALPDAALRQELVNVAGYPMDKPTGTLWGHARVLSDTTAHELIYLNDTNGGMSGSPVIQWDGQDYRVLGIHNYGDLAGNRATRITSDIFYNLQAWASQT